MQVLKDLASSWGQVEKSNSYLENYRNGGECKLIGAVYFLQCLLWHWKTCFQILS